MKKIFYSIFVIALGVMAVGCTREQEQTAEQATGSIVYKVTLKSTELTSATFTDAEGLKWQEGDVLRWEGNTGNTSHTLTAGEILDEGYTASFEIAIPNIKNEAPRGVFRFNYNSDIVTEWNFGSPLRIVTDPSITLSDDVLTYTQAEAGVMNRAFVFLHSATEWTDFAKADTETPEETATMQIVGSIFRFLPYTADYNDEEVESVTFSLDNKAKWLGGLVYYPYSSNAYLDANQKNLNKYYKAVVNLGTPFSLSGVTDVVYSKGIYFALPATNSPVTGGYTIVVKTDKATYTYNSTKDLSVGENKVRNIPILLDAAHRIADDAVVGALRYQGNINNNQTFTYDHEAQSNVDIGYWYAQVKNTGDADWTIKEASIPENAGYYAVSFSVIDDETGLAADWVTAAYGTNSTHWILNLTENTTGATRSATVTATFPAIVAGYLLDDGFATKVIKVTQTPELAPDVVIGDLSYRQNTSIGAAYNFNVSGAANFDLGWLLITTRLTGEAAWTGREAGDGDNDALYYAGITFDVIDDATGATATWCSINRPTKNTRWYVSVDANTGAARSATITAHFPTVSNHYQLVDGEASTKVISITQEAYESIDYVNEHWDGASISIAKTWYSPAGWAGGLTPNVTLSADGKTFTSVIPEGIGGAEWMGQNFLLSDILMEAGKKYKFSCTVNTTVAGTCTVKLGLWDPSANGGTGGDTNMIFYDNAVAVTAGTPLSFEKEALNPQINGDFRVVLIIDLGRSAAGSTWTFSDISLKSN